MPVKVDGEMISELSSGSHAFRDVPTGRHQLSVEMWGTPGVSRHDFQAAPGRTYYFSALFNKEKVNAQAAGMAFGVVGWAVATAATDDGKGPVEITAMTAAEARQAFAQ